MHKFFYDNFLAHNLVDGALFEGDAGIPVLFEQNKIELPNSLIPFDKVSNCSNKRQYVHFYIHDKKFIRFIIIRENI